METEKIDARKISTQAQKRKEILRWDWETRVWNIEVAKIVVYIIVQYLNGILNIKEIRSFIKFKKRSTKGTGKNIW